MTISEIVIEAHSEIADWINLDSEEFEALDSNERYEHIDSVIDEFFEVNLSITLRDFVSDNRDEIITQLVRSI